MRVRRRNPGEGIAIVTDDDVQRNALGAGELELALTFSYEPEGLTDELFGISEETLFTAFEHALEAVGVDRSVEVSVLITTDEGIQTLNRDYRGKDEPTDVLSFPLLDEPLVDAPADQLWRPGEDHGRAGVSGVPAVDAESGGEDVFPLDEDDEEMLDAILASEEEDWPTEDQEAGEGEWPLHLGDVAIARETVIRQAKRAGHSAAYEAAFLFVHGVLHLVGYDDQTDAGYRAMVAIQEAALARAGVAR
jgi:probable rRNA maturation factor